MKRKRGPAPRGNKRKHNQEVAEEHGKSKSGSEADSDIDCDEESFHGFSSDQNADIEQEEIEKDKPTATNGGIGRAIKKEKKTSPTNDELMDVFLRSSSFQSNLFKLQTEELLSEVRVNYHKMTKLETVLHQLKEVIMAIPASHEQLVDETQHQPLTCSCMTLKQT